MARRGRLLQPPTVGGRPRTVLIVDDIAAVRRSIAVLLGAAGFRVFEASDGAEALDVLHAASTVARPHERDYGGAIDLVITDVMMPFSGVALVQEIRARWPEQRVLYMSGFPTETLRAEGLRTIDGPFLAKPFNADELLDKVWEALQLRPADAARSPDAPATARGERSASPADRERDAARDAAGEPPPDAPDAPTRD